MSRMGTLLRQDGERGQAIVLLAVTLVVLMGAAALVVDVGRAYVVKRHLQASVDAAALAGAQSLPDVNAATAAANSYSGKPGAKNDAANLPDVLTSVTTKCLSQKPCNPANAIVVDETTTSPTIFAKVLGIDSFTIHARATALMSQGAPAPAHIMIVVDRTGSMNNPCNAGGTKMTCLRDGIKAFLTGMDPAYNKVGLIAFPPGTGNACTFSPKTTDGPTSDYDAHPNGYVVVPLSNDYKTSATSPLNSSSALVSTVNCIKAGGTTATATAIDVAHATLQASHDPKAQDVIIFMTDGESNYGPCTNPNGSGVCSNNSSPYRTQPCHQAITSAHAFDAQGTWIYTIAYGASGLVCKGWKSSGTGSDGQSCNKKNGYQFNCDEVPSITASTEVSAMASDPSKFFNEPNPGDLTTAFETIAEDLSGPALVDDNYTG
jgi:Putative Flp pilus-assembly TadE/G-like